MTNHITAPLLVFMLLISTNAAAQPYLKYSLIGTKNENAICLKDSANIIGTAEIGYKWEVSEGVQLSGFYLHQSCIDKALPDENIIDSVGVAMEFLF